jgi:SEC-C motif
LERCIQTVKDQSVAADHFLVSDGFPQDWLEGTHVRHLRLNRAHSDAGNTPRGIGAILAVSEGYDGIGLLDADNWYDKNHVEECCKAAYVTAQSPVDLVFAKRRIFFPDGQLVKVPDIDYIDTSCYWFLPGSFHLLHYWTIMPRCLGPVCDWVFYSMLRTQSLTIRNVEEITVNFTSTYAAHYRAMGMTPPRGAKEVNVITVFGQIQQLDLHQQELIRRRCGFDILEVAQMKELTNSRNAYCFCGSGKRFKHCHGKWPAIKSQTSAE